MNVLCTGNSSKEKFYPILNSLNIFFNESKNDTLFLDKFIKLNKSVNINSFDSIYNPFNKIDFVLCIGGDGAILSAIRRMKEKQLPILGLHIGKLGFLNKINSNNYIQSLKSILKSKAIIYDSKSLIKAQFSNDENKDIKLIAFNEIFISRTEVSRLLPIEVFINNELLNTYSCDGLIISSPMGSTAYSLSAGGPIVSPTVNCIIITPVSPHTLSSRPIIIKDNSKINIKPYIKDDQITIFSDSQISEKAMKNTMIDVSMSSVNAKFVSFKYEESYYEKLRDNLGWSR